MIGAMVGTISHGLVTCRVKYGKDDIKAMDNAAFGLMRSTAVFFPRQNAPEAKP